MTALLASSSWFRRAKALKATLVLVLFVGSLVFLLVRTGVIKIGESPEDWIIPEADLSTVEPRVRGYIDERRSSLEGDRASAAAWGEYGVALDAHQLNAEASEAYQRAGELEPGSFRWAYLYAISRYFMSEPPEAVVAMLDAALALNPQYAHGHVRRGNVLLNMGNNAEARAAYERAIELDPDLAIARRSLGQLLLTEGETADAVHHLEQAERLAPGDQSVATSLSQGYLRQGDRARADDFAARVPNLQTQIGFVDPLRREVEDQGQSTRLCDERAGRRMFERRYAEAIADLIIVVATYPNDPLVHQRIGICYEETGDINNAILHLTTALRMQSDLVDSHLRLAKIYWNQDWNRVARHYQAAIDHSPPNAEMYTRLAIATARQGLTAEALPAFERAVELAPNDPDKHSDLALAYLTLERFEEAAARCDAALELAPKHPKLNFILGQACEKLDRIEDAIAAYRRAAEADPASPAASRLVELTARQRQRND